MNAFYALVEVLHMPMMTVRNIPDEIHRALKARAALHGRSTEAEVRAILATSVDSETRVKLGSLLVEVGQQASWRDDEVTMIQQLRDKTPGSPIDFA